MRVHDTRLAGTAPRLAPNIYKVDQFVTINHALTWVARYATSQRGLTQLLIMCHGMSGAMHDTNAGLSTADLGFGLLFCKEDLTLANVAACAVLRGCVQEIVLYACGLARTRPSYEDSIADGARFCAELAAFTNASVVAPSQPQFYSMVPPANLLQRLFNIGPQDIIEFGPWEGRLTRFLPNGSRKILK